jgi:hypothetical protein
LLGLLLQCKPVERITFEEFFQHPFLSGSTGAAGDTAVCGYWGHIVLCGLGTRCIVRPWAL